MNSIKENNFFVRKSVSKKPFSPSAIAEKIDIKNIDSNAFIINEDQVLKENANNYL